MEAYVLSQNTRVGKDFDAGRKRRVVVMGSFSIWHWMMFGAVALLLFGGKGKISDIMGDVAKGIKSFKKNMAEPEDESMEASATKPGGTLSGPGAQAATTTRETSATH